MIGLGGAAGALLLITSVATRLGSDDQDIAREIAEPESASVTQEAGGRSGTGCGVPEVPSALGAAPDPERQMFTMESPADYAVLNAIEDNPNYGNERSFFDVKDASIETAGGFCNSIEVVDGQVLRMRVYVENSAADHLRGAEFDGPDIAQDTSLLISSDEQAASLHVVRATISSSTTDPREIHDGLFLVSDEPFRLDYLPGSATLYSNAHPSPGLLLSDEIWNGSGVGLGYEEMDGSVAPGYQYALYIIVRARVTTVR